MKKKATDNGKKPIPQRLSQWGSGTEMIYTCPECGASFAIYGDKQNYCHLCGLKLDWSDCPRYASIEFKSAWNALEKAYHESAGKISYGQFCEEQTALLFKWHKGELR